MSPDFWVEVRGDYHGTMSHASIRKKLLSWMDFWYSNNYVFRWKILAFGVGYVLVYPEFFTLYLFNSVKNPQISVDMISLYWTLYSWCYKDSRYFPSNLAVNPLALVFLLRPWPLYSFQIVLEFWLWIATPLNLPALCQKSYLELYVIPD